jgi:hypothetical protein
MGLSGCYALLKYLVVLVNLIFWVSTILSYIFNVFCLKYAVDKLCGKAVLICGKNIPVIVSECHIGCCLVCLIRGRIERIEPVMPYLVSLSR